MRQSDMSLVFRKPKTRLEIVVRQLECQIKCIGFQSIQINLTNYTSLSQFGKDYDFFFILLNNEKER